MVHGSFLEEALALLIWFQDFWENLTTGQSNVLPPTSSYILVVMPLLMAHEKLYLLKPEGI